MPIRPPALDDRQFDDLVAELLARIPAHTPEWTNPRVGDPGRTLIDLFAWLGDALLYRANLIPERQRLAFMRLLGQPLRPARPARGLVTVSMSASGSQAPCALRANASFSGPVPFEARDEFTVLPVTAAVFYKRLATAEDQVDPSLRQALATVHNHGAPVTLYLTTPLFTEGQPESGGVDVFGQSSDRGVWLALLAPQVKPEDQSKTTDHAREALVASPTGASHLLNIGFVPALPKKPDVVPALEEANSAQTKAPSIDIVPAGPAGEVPGSTPVRAQVPHIWEITVNTANQKPDADHPWQPQYATLEEVADGTQGLTRAGIVRLALPRSKILHAPENNVRNDLNAGVGDRPPRLDDAGLASRLVAWIRLRPRPQQTSSRPSALQFTFDPGAATAFDAPQLPNTAAASIGEVEHLWVTWLGINAVAVEQLVTRSDQIIGESSGSADQAFQLPVGSVEPETLLIAVEEPSGWQPWQRVDDLAALERDAMAARDARVYQLDPEAGIIHFGDGVRGRVPAVGARILVRQVRSGGGTAGNLPAGTLKKIAARTQTGLDAPTLVVAQPLPMTGGAEAETLAGAERRIPALFRHRERAVTPEDYNALARETPGVAVGRVELLPRFKPQQRFFNVPGVVSVMVLPDAPLSPAPNPRADRPFLEAVHSWLDARRPLGTELYVIGCEYVPVAVGVAVSVADGTAQDATLRAVREALVRSLWPLAGGGFDGKGWRLARTLSNRELAVEVARVPGVSEVNGINLFSRQNDLSWKSLGDARDGKEQNLTLCEWQLPELLAVVTTVGSDAPLSLESSGSPTSPDGGGTPTNPFADPSAVAVPVMPDICRVC